MAKVIFLGTAASIPSKDRDTTSFVFIHKGCFSLIDCPGSIIHKLAIVGIDYKKLDKVILTHDHPDHIYGIFHLIHAQAYLTKKLYIFTNPPVISLIKKMTGLLKLNKVPFPKLCYVNVFGGKMFYAKDGLTLSAVKNKHSYQSFGVKFSFNKQSLLYSSDTALFDGIIKESKNCEWLIHDCTASASFFEQHPSLYTMHTDSFTLADRFKNSRLKKVIPIHFLPLAREEEKNLKKELSLLKNKLLIPRDFQTIQLK
ncbi:MAG: ribonuclease Z [Candidatus Omnitrophota bacterium]